MLKNIIFFDLDETLFDHKDPSHYWFHELELYLKFLKTNHAVVFGIVTGCNIAEARAKIDALDIKVWPDFIGVGFGTDIYYREKQNYIVDSSWRRLQLSTYSKQSINNIVSTLKKYEIFLVKEERSDNNLKDSYYYFNAFAENHNLSLTMQLKVIKLLAKRNKIKVIISQCNHNIGDPEDAFDVDFIPLACGKENVARYLLKKYHLTKEQAFAFGDSENDLALLKSMRHGYAVANATPNLKRYIKNCCPYSYGQGIIASLKAHFRE
ncbi:HAD-IIB family hydrolase (plasmid) [Legionella sp. D16C41]|uniref:HAD-IIB family hydrolase n=1 Tax=Legionella sp. D16C41 TaxID=3402688 RepID=UPI003AF420DE